jgi:hypothetical protein
MMNPMPFLCAALTALIASCAGKHRDDPRFLEWLNATETYCASQFGSLPPSAAGKRDEYLQLAYETYYGGNRATFASKMAILYPNHQLFIDCVASAFPDLGLDSK